MQRIIKEGNISNIRLRERIPNIINGAIYYISKGEARLPL